MSERLRKEIIEEINDAWLNIKVKRDEIIRPLDILKTEDPDEFYRRFAWLLSQPDYFCFICRHILNVDILPFQGLIISEIWDKKFPMLIGSRGLGKTFLLSLYSILRALLLPNRKIVVVGSAFRQSKYLYDYMENIWKNAPILRDMCDQGSGPRAAVDMCRLVLNGSIASALPIGDGCVSAYTQITYDDCFSYITSKRKNVWGNGIFRSIDYNIDNGLKPTKIVTTNKGYSYEGTHNHAMKVLRNGEINWVRTDQMKIGDRILIDRSDRWHNGDFECSTDQAYALGLLIADGSLSNKNILGFATKDKQLAEAVKKLIDTSPYERTLEWRGINDPYHYICNSQDIMTWLINKYKIVGKRSYDKEFPISMLECNKSICASFISGLFDGDGNVTTQGYIEFTNTSERLIDQLHYILLHYGIVSKKKKNKIRDKNWRQSYSLYITGLNAAIFKKEIGFRLKRKNNKIRSNFGSLHEDIPVRNLLEGIILDNKEQYSKSNNTQQKVKDISLYKIQRRKRITKKTVYDFLKRCEIVGIKDKRINIIKNIINPDIYYDEIISIEDGECNTYDIHVPEGNEYCANGFFSHNSKIRGQRANDIICDEFASVSRPIFETVIAGFAAVSSSPAENVKSTASKKKADELGIELSTIEEIDAYQTMANQITLSGTAYYDFNHFADYWRKWKAIIKSKGDPNKLKEIFGGEEIPESFNYKDYIIFRIPVTALPKGFMDDAQVARSKATIHNGIYLMEYGASFTKDSQGFFKRSLIESCVGTDESPVDLPSGQVYFDPVLRGSQSRQYVIGVDPASEVDNFSIVVIEMHPDHRRIVYCWTINRKEHAEKVNKKLITENNFYSYCARKIRELMNVFPTARISMDSQGGGVSISEALHDDSQLLPGELPIWPIIEEDKEKDTDGKAGLHILELCQFAKYDWLAEANHGMRKDLEDRVLLFPRFDPITIGLSLEEDKMANRLYDTLEDCVMEIEELKNELCLIEVTQTPSGRDRWDTPEVKLTANRKTRMRKDRYSALLMANASARLIARTPESPVYMGYGGFATTFQKKPGFAEYTGPDWFIQGIKGVY